MSTPWVLTRAQARELDRLAVERLGMPSLLLMENAGAGAARIARELLREAGGGDVLVLAGTGNNGGDGFVLARHLQAEGVRVRIGAASDSASGDAALMRSIALSCGLECVPASTAPAVAKLERAAGGLALVVDALLGTGFRGELSPTIRRLAELAARLRARGARVLALDLPSGLEADEGRVAEGAVRADATATFAAYKPALLTREGAACAGAVRVVGLGFSDALAREWLLEGEHPARDWTGRGPGG